MVWPGPFGNDPRGWSLGGFPDPRRIPRLGCRTVARAGVRHSVGPSKALSSRRLLPAHQPDAARLASSARRSRHNCRYRFMRVTRRGISDQSYSDNTFPTRFRSWRKARVIDFC